MPHTYDCKRDTRDLSADRMLKVAVTAAVVYSLIDLRASCPPIDDQGAEGSCTANAGVGYAEYDDMRQGAPYAQLSRAFVYYTTRLLEGTASDDSGATIADVVVAMVKYGVCDEALMPYVVGGYASSP